MKLFHIEHRKNTGGRFSVLTETGIKVKKLNLIKNIEKSYIKNLKLFV